MNNLDRHTWEWSRGEKFAIKWLEDRGYAVTVKSRHVTADYLIVSKDGTTTKFRLPLGDPAIRYREVMQQFEQDFKLLVRLREVSGEMHPRDAG